jgi:hypothetical protein
MKKENLLQIWLYVAVIAAAYYFFYHAKQKKKYYDAIHSLGFGDFWIDQLSFRELKDWYTFIFEYTQKGKMPIIGSSLDLRLVELGKKYPSIINYK